MTIDTSAYTDLLSHSAAVEEIHALATLLAKIVTAHYNDDRALSVLLQQAACRPSVVRRLTEM